MDVWFHPLSISAYPFGRRHPGSWSESQQEAGGRRSPTRTGCRADTASTSQHKQPTLTHTHSCRLQLTWSQSACLWTEGGSRRAPGENPRSQQAGTSGFILETYSVMQMLQPCYGERMVNRVVLTAAAAPPLGSSRIQNILTLTLWNLKCEAVRPN